MTVAHATEQDLADWMGEDQTVPTNAGRLLERASELVDEVVTVFYRTDAQGDPVDDQVADALRDATCAQVEWWAKVGEDPDVDGAIQQVQIGSVQIGYGAGSNRIAPAVVSRRTLRALRAAGLLYRGVGIR